MLSDSIIISSSAEIHIPKPTIFLISHKTIITFINSNL